MKTTLLRLISLMIVAIPMTAPAQNNIKKAFNAIIECSDAQITESHTLEKNTTTQSKTGQCDIYNFVLPADKMGLVKKVIAAFGKDNDTAYAINQGNSDSAEMGIRLAVGDDSNSGVSMTEKGREYIYALFLASKDEDPDGIYRYAYGMNHKEKNGKITGKLVITYATTLQYRQQQKLEKQYELFNNISESSIIRPSLPSLPSATPSRQPWFDTLMTYFGGMTSATSQTRIALATKAYKLICDTSNYTDVTKADKDSVREILKGMIAEEKYSETVLNKLLKRCLENLK